MDNAHRSSYLGHIHREQQTYVDRACIDLAGKEFDAVAFTGMSGAVMGPVIAYRLNKKMICCRKPEEDCHASYKVEAPTAPVKYIVIDDQIASGATINRMLDRIDDDYDGMHTCEGIYLYNYPKAWNFPRESSNPERNASVPVIGSKYELIEQGFSDPT